MPWAASGALDGEVVVWDVRTGQTRAKFEHDVRLCHSSMRLSGSLNYSMQCNRMLLLK